MWGGGRGGEGRGGEGRGGGGGWGGASIFWFTQTFVRYLEVIFPLIYLENDWTDLWDIL